MRPILVNPALVLFAVFTVLATACQSAPSGSAPSASAPAGSSRLAVSGATLPPAPANASGRKEVTLVAGPRQRLEETFAALQRSDIPAARNAFDAFNSDWNGIEVYVNFRSRALYGEIETHYEADIADALKAQSPDPVQIIPLLQGMVGQYDEAIKLSDTGPALSPLFDDVATVRIVRAPLRIVSPALKAGDIAKAKTGFTAFKSRWGEAQPLFEVRSSEAAQETAGAVAQADAAMSPATVDAAAAGRFVDALTERYNYGLNLVNVAARNADLSKTAFTDDDLQIAAALGGISQELKASLSIWENGDYSAAGDRAAGVAGTRFSRVSSALQAKSGADAPLQKALETYRDVAGQPGDLDAVRAANKAAVEAVAVAQQTVVGQFWTEPTFKDAYQWAVTSA